MYWLKNLLKWLKMACMRVKMFGYYDMVLSKEKKENSKHENN